MTRLACLIGAALLTTLVGTAAALPHTGTDAAIAWTVAATCTAIPLAVATAHHTRKDGRP